MRIRHASQQITAPPKALGTASMPMNDFKGLPGQETQSQTRGILDSSNMIDQTVGGKLTHVPEIASPRTSVPTIRHHHAPGITVHNPTDPNSGPAITAVTQTHPTVSRNNDDSAQVNTSRENRPILHVDTNLFSIEAGGIRPPATGTSPGVAVESPSSKATPASETIRPWPPVPLISLSDAAATNSYTSAEKRFVRKLPASPILRTPKSAHDRPSDEFSHALSPRMSPNDKQPSPSDKERLEHPLTESRGSVHGRNSNERVQKWLEHMHSPSSPSILSPVPLTEESELQSTITSPQTIKVDNPRGTFDAGLVSLDNLDRALTRPGTQVVVDDLDRFFASHDLDAPLSPTGAALFNKIPDLGAPAAKVFVAPTRMDRRFSVRTAALERQKTTTRHHDLALNSRHLTHHDISDENGLKRQHGSSPSSNLPLRGPGVSRLFLSLSLSH
jgi:hypothetical protein